MASTLPETDRPVYAIDTSTSMTSSAAKRRSGSPTSYKVFLKGVRLTR